MSDTFKAIRIDKDNETQKVNLVELKERKTNSSKKFTPDEAYNFLIKEINFKK